MIEVLAELVTLKSCLFLGVLENETDQLFTFLDLLSGREPGTGIQAILHSLINPVNLFRKPFFHSSFPDFLQNPSLSLGYTVDCRETSRKLLWGCLDYMSSMTLQTQVQNDPLAQFVVRSWWNPSFCWVNGWGRGAQGGAPRARSTEFSEMYRRLLEIDFKAFFAHSFTHPKGSSLVNPFLATVPVALNGGRFWSSERDILPFSTVEDYPPHASQALSHLVVSYRAAMLYVLQTHHPRWSEIFCLRVSESLLGLAQQTARAEDWSSDSVVQAMKRLRRDSPGHVDSLIRYARRELPAMSTLKSCRVLLDFIEDDSA
jgi:hypothetical protein